MRETAISTKPRSLTHQHLFAVTNTLIKMGHDTDVIRVLDAGCGDGQLLSFMYSKLHEYYPDKTIELYGFDVIDHGVQADGFLDAAIGELNTVHPEVTWRERLRAIELGSEWPFETGFFDVVVSNQVLEHVRDKEVFFENANRVLCKTGSFVALNPLRHCLWEGHIHLPFAHKIANWSTLYSYISLMSRLGFGKYRAQKNASNNLSVTEYAERHADYLFFWTSYSSESETAVSS